MTKITSPVVGFLLRRVTNSWVSFPNAGRGPRPQAHLHRVLAVPFACDAVESRSVFDRGRPPSRAGGRRPSERRLPAWHQRRLCGARGTPRTRRYGLTPAPRSLSSGQWHRRVPRRRSTGPDSRRPCPGHPRRYGGRPPNAVLGGTSVHVGFQRWRDAAFGGSPRCATAKVGDWLFLASGQRNSDRRQRQGLRVGNVVIHGIDVMPPRLCSTPK